MNTYLGKKGYTIYKNQLSLEQIKKIKTDLTIKPNNHGCPNPNSNEIPNIYFVYRESNNKLYVPLHYGIKNFGEPSKIELNDGENIDIEFNGQLRDYQVPVVEKYLETIKNNAGGGLLELPCGFGKCLAKGTRIMLADGSIEYVENIRVGDYIMGDDSTPRKVLSLATGVEQMY